MVSGGRGRRPASGAETRERILAAAAEVMAEHGLANATTKEIAKAAGYSEATLYKHFTGKEALFVEVLRERFPAFVDELSRLAESAGQGDVRGRLIGLVRQAVPFYRRGVPMFGALFAEPALLRRHREGAAEREAGPLNANRLLADYFRRERELGNLAHSLDADAAAALLVGACFQRGFLEAFQGEEFPAPEEFAVSVVDTLLGDVTG